MQVISFVTRVVVGNCHWYVTVTLDICWYAFRHSWKYCPVRMNICFDKNCCLIKETVNSSLSCLEMQMYSKFSPRAKFMVSKPNCIMCLQPCVCCQHCQPAAAHLLRAWVRIPPGAWIFVRCECRVLSGRGLCDELISRPEESYRLWCVVVCDLETSRMGAPCIYDVSSLRVNDLTLILLTWRK